MGRDGGAGWVGDGDGDGDSMTALLLDLVFLAGGVMASVAEADALVDADETVTTAALKPHKHTTKTNKQQGERSTPHKGLVGILERGS